MNFASSQPQRIFASKLFTFDEFQQEDAMEREMLNDYGAVFEIIHDKTDVEISAELLSQVSQTTRRHDTIQRGLLFGVLTRPEIAEQWYRYLCFSVKDNFALVIKQLKYISAEMYMSLQDSVKNQVIWLVGQVIDKKVPGIESIVLQLMKNIRGGDLSHNNMQLVERLLVLFSLKQQWMLSHHGVVSTAVYTFLRCVLDHGKYPDLQSQEISLCVKLLQEKFTECSFVGRDLIRVLRESSSIPEIGNIYRAIMNNSYSATGFSGVEKLLLMPTPRHFIQSRLTYDMEKNLLFILEKVEWGRNDDTYFQWFYDMYLAQSETESLYSDLIRFITCNFHPSNELLQSKIIPRYAAIGKLLKTSKAKTVASSIKLALFFDWIGFDPQRDSIMNIEPAILLIDRSVDKYVHISHWCLEYLNFLAHEFYPPLKQFIQEHLAMAIGVVIDKGVIKSLDHLMQASSLEPHAKAIVQEIWVTPLSERRKTSNVQYSPYPPPKPEESIKEQIEDTVHLELSDIETPPQFNVPDDLWMFGDLLKRFHEAVQSKNADQAREVFTEVLPVLAKMEVSVDVLARVCHDDLVKSAGTEPPLGVFSDIFKTYAQLMIKAKKKALQYSQFIRELRNQDSAEGETMWRFFVYLMDVFKMSPEKLWALYETVLGDATHDSFTEDIKSLEENDVESYFRLVPWFPEWGFENFTIVRQLVACCYPVQTYRLRWLLSQNSFPLVKPETLLALLQESLDWDAFEQQNLWELLAGAFSGSQALLTAFAESAATLIPQMNPNDHPEFCSGMTCVLSASSNLSQDLNIVSSLLLASYEASDFSTPIHIPILTQWLRQKSSTLISILRIVITECEHRLPDEQDRIRDSLNSWQASIQQLDFPADIHDAIVELMKEE